MRYVMFGLKSVLLFTLFSFSMTGCAVSQAPLSERTQLMLVSESQEIDMGEEAAAEIKQKNKNKLDTKYVNRIRTMSQKIATVANKPQYQWEFHVIDEKTINAFCLPGGKVFVYTGLIEFADNDAQIASVIGHEVAHAIARHGAERMSMSMASNMLQQVIGAAVGSEYKQTFDMAYGYASNLGVMLPYSRRHEHEADSIGLFYMAQAGYDPREAVKFWEKMQQRSGRSGSDFLSTHPSDDKRIAELNRVMPEALNYYQAAKK